MKAIIVHQWCDPRGLVMEDVARPEPGATAKCWSR